MPEYPAYFDHASTTPLRKSALDAMMPYLSEKYGNASSPHAFGRQSRAAIDNARDLIASALGVSPREIIFTSGGTESIISSLVGSFLGNRHKGNHILTTAFEHHATLAVFEFLRNEFGAETEFIRVDRNGLADIDDLSRKLRYDTVFVSVMRVNNEIGTIQNIPLISEICSEKGVILHSDYVQAVGKLPVNLNIDGVDLACISGHKLGGPKGIGILYVREGTHLIPLCEGSQEYGLRSGTENVSGIVGLSVALDEACREVENSGHTLAGFRKQLWDVIISTDPEAVLNCGTDCCVPAILNVRLKGIEGEMLVLALDRAGVAVSTGSACSAGSTEPSHVLTAIGLSLLDALSSARISMGYTTTQRDIDKFIDIFPRVYHQVRGSVS